MEAFASTLANYVGFGSPTKTNYEEYTVATRWSALSLGLSSWLLLTVDPVFALLECALFITSVLFHWRILPSTQMFDQMLALGKGIYLVSVRLEIIKWNCAAGLPQVWTMMLFGGFFYVLGFVHGYMHTCLHIGAILSSILIRYWNVCAF